MSLYNFDDLMSIISILDKGERILSDSEWSGIIMTCYQIDEDLQNACADVICRSLGHREVRERFSNIPGSLSALAFLIRSPYIIAQGIAATALYRAFTQFDIVENFGSVDNGRGMLSLVSLLHSPDLRVACQASCCLAVCGHHSQNKVMFSKLESGLESLVRLIQPHHGWDNKRAACKALAAMCDENVINCENFTGACGGQGLEYLVLLLKDDEDEMIVAALSAMWAITQNPHNRELFCRTHEAMDVCVDLLFRSDDEETLALVISVLSNVCTFFENRRELTSRPGAIERICSFVFVKNVELVRSTLALITNLSIYQRAREDIGKVPRCLKRMVQLVNDDSDLFVKDGAADVDEEEEYGRNDAWREDAAELRKLAISALWSSCSECDLNREVLWRDLQLQGMTSAMMNVISCLTENAEDTELLYRAGGLLAFVFFCSERLRVSFSQHPEAMEGIVELLRSQHEETAKAAAQVLMKSFATSKCKEEFATVSRGMSSLCGMLLSKDDTVKMSAVLTLVSATEVNGNRVAFAKVAGATMSLAQILQTTHTSALQVSAAQAMANLFLNNNVVALFNRVKGGVDTLVKFLSPSVKRSLRLAASLCVIRGLNCSDDFRAMFLGNKQSPLRLKEILVDVETQVRRLGCSMLQEVMSEKNGRDCISQFQEGDVLFALSGLLRSTEDEEVRECLLLIPKICKSKTCQTVLGQTPGCMGALVDVVRRFLAGSREMREIAITAQCHILYGSKENNELFARLPDGLIIAFESFDRLKHADESDEDFNTYRKLCFDLIQIAFSYESVDRVLAKMPGGVDRCLKQVYEHLELPTELLDLTNEVYWDVKVGVGMALATMLTSSTALESFSNAANCQSFELLIKSMTTALVNAEKIIEMSSKDSSPMTPIHFAGALAQCISNALSYKPMHKILSSQPRLLQSVSTLLRRAMVMEAQFASQEERKTQHGGKKLMRKLSSRNMMPVNNNYGANSSDSDVELSMISETIDDSQDLGGRGGSFARSDDEDGEVLEEKPSMNRVRIGTLSDVEAKLCKGLLNFCSSEVSGRCIGDSQWEIMMALSAIIVENKNDDAVGSACGALANVFLHSGIAQRQFVKRGRREEVFDFSSLEKKKGEDVAALMLESPAAGDMQDIPEGDEEAAEGDGGGKENVNGDESTDGSHEEVLGDHVVVNSLLRIIQESRVDRVTQFALEMLANCGLRFQPCADFLRVVRRPPHNPMEPLFNCFSLADSEELVKSGADCLCGKENRSLAYQLKPLMRKTVSHKMIDLLYDAIVRPKEGDGEDTVNRKTHLRGTIGDDCQVSVLGALWSLWGNIDMAQEGFAWKVPGTSVPKIATVLQHIFEDNILRDLWLNGPIPPSRAATASTEKENGRNGFLIPSKKRHVALVHVALLVVCRLGFVEQFRTYVCDEQGSAFGKVLLQLLNIRVADGSEIVAKAAPASADALAHTIEEKVEQKVELILDPTISSFTVRSQVEDFTSTMSLQYLVLAVASVGIGHERVFLADGLLWSVDITFENMARMLEGDITSCGRVWFCDDDIHMAKELVVGVVDYFLWCTATAAKKTVLTGLKSSKSDFDKVVEEALHALETQGCNLAEGSRALGRDGTPLSRPSSSKTDKTDKAGKTGKTAQRKASTISKAASPAAARRPTKRK